MRIILRGLVGLISLLMLAIAVSVWADPVKFPASLGLAPMDALGRATMRADLGAFFAVVGGFGLLGAVRDSRRLMTAPLALSALALAARGFTAAVEGFEPQMAQPMVVETVMVLLYGAGRRVFRNGEGRSPG